MYTRCLCVCLHRSFLNHKHENEPNGSKRHHGKHTHTQTHTHTHKHKHDSKQRQTEQSTICTAGDTAGVQCLLQSNNRLLLSSLKVDLCKRTAMQERTKRGQRWVEGDDDVCEMRGSCGALTNLWANQVTNVGVPVLDHRRPGLYRHVCLCGWVWVSVCVCVCVCLSVALPSLQHIPPPPPLFKHLHGTERAPLERKTPRNDNHVLRQAHGQQHLWAEHACKQESQEEW